MLNPNATTEPTQDEDGAWHDGFEVDCDRPRLEHIVATCNANLKKAHAYEPETREDFATGPLHGITLNVRRKRMGSTWDTKKWIVAEFGIFAGVVDGHWVVCIKDLLGSVYGFAEYTSAAELHKVWELD